VPVRLCAVESCGQPANLERRYRGRCAKHFREREQRTRPIGYSTYRSKRWRMLAKRVKFEQPLCPGLPGEPGCGAIATEVDHIVPLAAGGQPFARSNVQALCASCHARKTRAERAGTAEQGSA